jgi:hypothetical protein
MKTFFALIMLTTISILVSCSSDSNTNTPSGGFAFNMSITGDKVLEFKTNTATLIPPVTNPNYIVSGTMISNGMTHVYSMTLDSAWLNKTNIDLSRDNNLGTFQYDGGKDGNTYRVVSGNLIVETLNNTRLKGTLNFSAVKIGTTDVKIEVKNGIIDISK